MLASRINSWEVAWLKNYYPFETIKNLPMLQWDVYQHVITLDRYFLTHGRDEEFNQAFASLMEPFAIAGLLTQSVAVKPEHKFQYLVQLKLFEKKVVSDCQHLMFLVENFISSIARMLAHD